MNNSAGAFDPRSTLLAHIANTQLFLIARAHFMRYATAMTNDEMNALLLELGLTQADFAKLAGTSLRTVNLWATGHGKVAGPAEAYLRLLKTVPRSFLEIEKNKITGERAMAEGMYQIDFAGTAGSGTGILVLDKGKVFGVDTERVRYDGEYEPSPTNNHTSLKLRVSVPPGVNLVQGLPPQSTEFAFSIEADIPTANEASFLQSTPFGDVTVIMRKVRSLPN